jgi:diaminohydroxyphosphoribosylaminopyrimidine deaminase/5-amino-6-(5-phosphoribosylamino)uracil reductase
VFAWREPTLFVQGTGAERLRAHGIEIVELPELAGAAREPNAHLLDR